MLNQVVLVGRIAQDKLNLEKNDNKDYCSITIAVPRSFKNSEGEYETDMIKINLYGGIAKNTAEFCSKGDIIGVKGRVQQDKNRIVIVAEKVTFLSSKSTQEGVN